MRRSKAPSMLIKSKGFSNRNNINTNSDLEAHGSEPEDDCYKWGTKNNENLSSRSEHKRIFNILWRDVSAKKHKTWKGDGTLEVNDFTAKAILRDETGKYMGCSTKFNKNDLGPDFQMIIGGKEIEIQNEIIDTNEVHELRKRQIQYVKWNVEDYISHQEITAEESKPKGGFKFKPVLTLKPPEIPNKLTKFEKQNKIVELDFSKNSNQQNTKTSECKTKCYLPSSSVQHSYETPRISVNTANCEELLCFLRPSDLQQLLFQKIFEYYSSVKSHLSPQKIKTLNFTQVLEHICNHPSLINCKLTSNALLCHLLPNLPDWSEMGPFDSGKVEFVQYFLNHLLTGKSQKCIILAKNTNTLNMIQGLCDFMNIKCLRLCPNLEEDIKTEILMGFSLMEKQILLTNTVEILKHMEFPINCRKLIVFEDVSRSIQILNSMGYLKNFKIYYLITAFSVEELLLLDLYTVNEKNNNEHSLEKVEELYNLSNIDDNCCYLHTIIGCTCFEETEKGIGRNNSNMFIKNWQHFLHPFDDEFLKINSLENLSESIVTIFYKKQ